MKDKNAGFSNIVSVLSRRKPMIFAALSQVEAYWEALRPEGGLPPRSAIEPRGIEAALEYTFILECVAPGIARFRLAGMHLTDLMGMEVRGMPLTAMFMPEARSEVGKTLTDVCARPQVSQLVLKAERSIGRPALDARMLLAPLTNDFGEVNRILGCIQSNGTIGRQPRRFSVAEVVTRQLATVTVRTRMSADLAEPGFAEAERPFQPRAEGKRPGDSRPALRLVSSKD